MHAPQPLQHEKTIFSKIVVEEKPIKFFAMHIVALPLVVNPHQTVPELEKAL
ncbi:hypothetical protein [Bartonella massiliensis]|uniref:hypothetical protein n=1 Tax=Bartonella massiliensis TaxID=929795 RepID=UPI00163C5310|nr:hypothetical protein [Bartonella massiliensis]